MNQPWPLIWFHNNLRRIAQSQPFFPLVSYTLVPFIPSSSRYHPQVETTQRPFCLDTSLIGSPVTTNQYLTKHRVDGDQGMIQGWSSWPMTFVNLICLYAPTFLSTNGWNPGKKLLQLQSKCFLLFRLRNGIFRFQFHVGFRGCNDSTSDSLFWLQHTYIQQWTKTCIMSW